jgi:hypothetical protein
MNNAAPGLDGQGQCMGAGLGNRHEVDWGAGVSTTA